jgi:hypothetical protein
LKRKKASALRCEKRTVNQRHHNGGNCVVLIEEEEEWMFEYARLQITQMGRVRCGASWRSFSVLLLPFTPSVIASGIEDGTAFYIFHHLGVPDILAIVRAFM